MKKYRLKYVALALYCPESTVAYYCKENNIQGKDGMTMSEILDFSRSSYRHWKGHDEVEEIKRYLRKIKEKQIEMNERFGTRTWHYGDEE